MTMPLEAPARPSTNGHAPGTVLRAAIYCRVSTAGQAEDGYSLDGQLEEGRKLAEQLPAEVVLERQEQGSGADWELPMLLELLEAARRGEYHILICYASSRLARELGKLLVVERELKRSGVEIKYVTQQHDDSPQGRLTRNIFGAFDEFERENIALRFALGKRAKAAKGLVVGGNPAPFGYRYVTDHRGVTVGLELNPKAAPIMRRIIADLQCYSLSEVCDRLNAENIPTPGKATRWAQSTIVNMLASPVYLGRYYFGRFAYESRGKRKIRRHRDLSNAPYINVPILITEDELEAARAGMARRKIRHAARRYRAEVDPYTLRGLLMCGLCGGQMACVTGGNPAVRYYSCLRAKPCRARDQGRARCAMPSVPAAGIEDHAWKLVKGTLLDADYLRVGMEEARKANRQAERRQQHVKDLKTEIDRRNRDAERLVNEWLATEPGGVVAQALKAKASQLEAEVSTLRAQLADLQQRPIQGLTEDDATALESFAASIRSGIEKADKQPWKQRRAYELLRLEGRAAESPDGVKLARSNCSKRFAFDWQSLIELRNGVRPVLAGGVTTSLSLDPHGKTRSSFILDLPIDVPDDYVPPRRHLREG